MGFNDPARGPGSDLAVSFAGLFPLHYAEPTLSGFIVISYQMAAAARMLPDIRPSWKSGNAEENAEFPAADLHSRQGGAFALRGIERPDDGSPIQREILVLATPWRK